MAVTPNYGWPVPVATDLVKDGYEAIADLGDAIDATVFGLPASGMSLINTTTLSAVSSQSFNNVFSATYNNYYIQMSLDGSTTNQDVNFRLRVSGSDNSSANYSRSNLFQQSTTVTGQSITGQTSWISVCEVISTMRQYGDLIVFNPFLTQFTGGISNSLGVTNGATYQERTNFGTTITTSYTGFTLLVGTGTMSGSVSVYGYKI